MAAETGDCVSFQAERLPSGSISFGRFEVESLSWERRSSFSHNRYLEEVEKCSTPGSVTQKRAILEAHFKKKHLLPQASSEHQDEAMYQSTTNHTHQQTSHCEELVDNDSKCHPEFAWYDESPAVPDENEVMEGEHEQQTSPLEFSNGCAHYGDEVVLHPSSELANQPLQPQPEHRIKPNHDKLCDVVELEPDNKAVIVEELLEKREDTILEELLEKKEDTIVQELLEKREDTIVEELHENKVVPVRCSKVEEINVNSLKQTQKASPKVNEGVEQKSLKTKRTQVPVEQSLRKSSIKKNTVGSVNMLSKSVEKAERENLSTGKSVKQSPFRTSRPTSSNSKNMKLEPPETFIAKVRKEKKSMKDVPTKKASIPTHSVSRKNEMDIHQTVNRSKEVSDSTKEETKQSGVVFSFKSEERAERRKEYYMKLEEKLHAKEAEMNEIQARTQEEKEAEIKQLRRNLKFKATPMPSFYHEAVPRVSEGKKNVVATPRKPQKVQTKCRTSGSRTSREKSSTVSESANRESTADALIRESEKTEAEKKDEGSRVTVKHHEQHQEGIGKKRDGVRRKVVKNGMIGGNVAAVHVAS